MNTASNRASGKKRVSHGFDTERSKRETANMIERRRMQNINCGFSSLKKLLPPSNRKQTKAAILQQASQHILRLQRAIIQFKAENDSLRTVLGAKNATSTNLYVAPCSDPSIPQCTNKQREYDNHFKQRSAILECNSKPNMVKQTRHNTAGDGRLMEYSTFFARERSIAVECDNELSLSNKMKYDDSLAQKRSTTVMENKQESYLSKKRLLEPTSSSLEEYDPSQANKRNTAASEYECEPTFSSKALHQPLCIPKMDCSWKRFEHVKKFKPLSPSGFRPEGIDSKPPTPPVSPEMVNQGVHIFNGSKLPALTSSRFSLTSCPPICHHSSEEFGRLQLEPWKKSIFNSTVHGSSSADHAHGKKSKSYSHDCYALKDRSNKVGIREGREGDGQENYQGDLQSIIDAIHIIEKKI